MADAYEVSPDVELKRAAGRGDMDAVSAALKRGANAALISEVRDAMQHEKQRINEVLLEAAMQGEIEAIQ